MVTIRRAEERGKANYGWLDTRHTFSFADYHDPAFHRFRTLRVMNEDWVSPGKGFGTHPHRDMEIVTYVLEGALEHRDSMGNGKVLRAGELQVMSAGTGITHSEFNPSGQETVHLYQIWLLPQRKGLTPRYDQKAFDRQSRQNKWQLVASPTSENDSLLIQQDARIFLADLEPDHAVSFTIPDQRYAWLQVVRGDVIHQGQRLRAGDGLALESIPGQAIEHVLQAESPAELLRFDLA